MSGSFSLGRTGRIFTVHCQWLLFAFDPFVLTVIGLREGEASEAIDPDGPEMRGVNLSGRHGMMGGPSLIYLAEFDRKGFVGLSGRDHDEGIRRFSGGDFGVGVFEEEKTPRLVGN